jgi:hypothetical protein
VACLRAEMQVRKDQRVVDMRIHGFGCSRRLLRGYECCINFGTHG